MLVVHRKISGALTRAAPYASVDRTIRLKGKPLRVSKQRTPHRADSVGALRVMRRRQAVLVAARRSALAGGLSDAGKNDADASVVDRLGQQRLVTTSTI